MKNWIFVLLASLALACGPNARPNPKTGLPDGETQVDPNGENQNPDPGQPPTDNPNVPPPPPVVEVKAEHDPIKAAKLPTGEASIAAVCAQGFNTLVTQRFCTTPRPQIRSLQDLQALFGFTRPFPQGTFAITGHSSSLVTRFTNPMNPRLVLFSGANTATAISIGFVRGEQFAELTSFDATRNEFVFFLVAFKQACNAADGGCTLADLLSPDIETNWTEVSLYSQTDLANTVIDCLMCHKPDNAQPSILRMQELENPWNHWFRNNGPTNALINVYTQAKGNEPFAGVPTAQFAQSRPQDLETDFMDRFMGGGTDRQPNLYNSATINQQAGAAGTNPSAAWAALYRQTLAGAAIPPPVRAINIADPAMLQAAGTNYRGVIAGTIPRAQMMDNRAILSEQTMREMSLRPGALDANNNVIAPTSGAAIIVQMCARCHNPNLNQTLTRAKFDAMNLPAMDRRERDIAIARVTKKDKHDVLIMPPHGMGELSEAEIQLVVEELRKNP